MIRRRPWLRTIGPVEPAADGPVHIAGPLQAALDRVALRQAERGKGGAA